MPKCPKIPTCDRQLTLKRYKELCRNNPGSCYMNNFFAKPSEWAKTGKEEDK